MKKKLIPKPYNDFFALIKIWVGLLVLGIILLQFDEKVLLKDLIFNDIDLKLNLSWTKNIFTIFCFI